ncbi:hypothetical protein FF36_04158 [Frankia torreyi]|uniref:Membrane protein involved in the export of O-antigen and teichoic acid n=1 Tax=Frankia torreyi TaxID=1856 RepID=A0A0D8BDJ7_9ACTN|nr:hypothetical protein FF36_04158 [Frankia torreyi]
MNRNAVPPGDLSPTVRRAAAHRTRSGPTAPDPASTGPMVVRPEMNRPPTTGPLPRGSGSATINSSTTGPTAVSPLSTGPLSTGPLAPGAMVAGPVPAGAGPAERAVPAEAGDGWTLRKRLRQTRGTRLRGALRGAVPLALAGLLANAANMGVTLIIARAMSTRSYGAVAQLIAIFFVVSMPGSALLVGVVRRVTTWQHSGRLHLMAAWVNRVRRVGVATVLVVAVLAIIGRGYVARELSLPGPGGVAEIITAGAAWCLLCVDRGLLQCARQYPALATNLLVDAVVKTVFTIGLVLVGLDESGAAIGVLLGVLAALAHVRWTLYRSPETMGRSPETMGRSLEAPGRDRAAPPPGQPPPAAPTLTPTQAPTRLAVEVGAALVALALLGLLQNVDVLLQGRLAPDRSGSYAAVSVASKVIVLAAVVLAGFLLPEAADRRHLGQHALHQLGATIAILLVPAMGLLFAALIAPEKLLSLAFGPRFTDASGALLPLAAAMTCLGATVLFTHYLLALGERGVLLALGLAAAATIPLLVWADGSPTATARADLACQAALAVVTGLSVLAAARRTARA